ncbi:hypothetical protein HDU92_008031 [Lobulomyces angularis]|nr:hypothetical protein HDU92_008031 [Lobulomyces angularis]
MNIVRISRTLQRGFASNLKNESAIPEEVKKSATETYNKLKDVVTPNFEQADSSAGTTAKDGTSAKETEEFVSHISEKANNAKTTDNNSVGAKVKEKVEDAKQYVGDKVEDLKEAFNNN